MSEDIYVEGNLIRLGKNPRTGRDFLSPVDCLSTHGASGYAWGSFVYNKDIVCGICGTVIEHKGRKPKYILS